MSEQSTDAVERAIATAVSSINGVSDPVIDRLDDEFGSATAIANARPNELQEVDGIGPQISRKIARHTNTAKKHPEFFAGGESFYDRDIRRGRTLG
ncbi:MAG: hypothetical protein HQRvContig02_30 [Haloquadratum phage sp.]|nr:MAG: hypothetical protein HQRvContig02_30 [Haloquadratum phage sp.]